jgi:DNA-binding CsgD family transcriptional regulator
LGKGEGGVRDVTEGSSVSGEALIGRSAEIATLKARAGSDKPGSRRCVIVRGEPGIGKTALLESVAAAPGGALAVSSSGNRSEREWPYAGVQMVSRDLAGYLADLAEARHRRVLQRIHTLDDVASLESRDVASALLALFDHVSARTPIHWTVDDAQHLDRWSADAIAFVCRRLRGMGVSVLVGHDDTEMDHRWDGIEVMYLDGLALDECIRLLSVLTGGNGTDPVYARLADAAQRNPLVLREYARTIPPEELLGDVPLSDPLPLSPSLRERFGPGLDRWSPAEHAVALRLALDGLPVDEAAAVDGIEDAGDALLELSSRDVVVHAVRGWRIRHQVIRSLILARASASERAQAHGELATILDGHDPVRALWHRASASAGTDPGLLDLLHETGVQLADHGDAAYGARIVGHAARLTRDPNRTAELTYLAGRLAIAGGHLQYAEEYVNVGLRGTPDRRTRVNLIRLKELAAFLHHHVVQPEAMSVTAETVAAEDASLAASLYLQTAKHLVDRYELGPADTFLTHARRLLDQAGPEAMDDFLRTEAWLAATRGDFAPSERWLATKNPPSTDVLKEMDRAFRRVSLLIYTERHDEARAELLEQRQSTRFGGIPIVDMEFGYLQILLELRAGNVRAAQQAADTLRNLVAPDMVAAPHRNSLLARLASVTGDYDKARRHIQLAHAAATQSNSPQARLLVPREIGYLALIQDRPADAAPHLQQAADVIGDLANPTHFYVEGDLIEALALGGHTRRARQQLATLEGHVQQTTTAWGVAMVARGHALLSDDDTAVKNYDRSLDAARQPGVSPLELGRAETLYGTYLARHGRRADARRHLETARDIFHRHGAKGWLFRAGDPTINPDAMAITATFGEVLSEREQQIMHLAGTRIANREISETLHVSVRTVETHLTRIYQKLDVHSRRELVELLRQPITTD